MSNIGNPKTLVLEGRSGFANWDKVPVNMAPVDSSYTPKAIEAVIEGDNLDEIVIQDSRGKFYIIWADELLFYTRTPHLGDWVRYRDIRGRLIFLDDEANENNQCRAIEVGGLLVGGIGGAIFKAAIWGAAAGGILGESINYFADICEDNDSALRGLLEK